MSFEPARRPATLSLWRCLRAAWWPTLAAAAGALAGAFWFAPRLDEGAVAAGAMTPWLRLPMLVLDFVCACTAVVLWPAFSERRPGADWLARLQRGPLRGCGGVIAGALAAQLLLTVPITTALAGALGAPPAARAWVALRPPAEALLDAQQRVIVFAVPHGLVASELHLRPIAGPPVGGFQASRVAVRIDGEAVASPPVAFQQSNEFAAVALPPRAIARLELELLEGTVPLFFPAGSTALVGAATVGSWWNGLLAALLGLLPTFVALAVACLCGTKAALPTVLTVVSCLLFVQTVGGAGPLDPTLLHLLRGHWLPSTAAFRECIPSLAVGGAAMIGAMLLRRRLPG